MGNPTAFDDGQEVERLSLDIPVRDLELLTRFAAYRNTLATIEGKKLKRKWTRKSFAEHLLAIQCDVLRQQLEEMFRACGEIPPADDADALEKYVRKVIAWDKRNAK